MIGTPGASKSPVSTVAAETRAFWAQQDAMLTAVGMPRPAFLSTPSSCMSSNEPARLPAVSEPDEVDEWIRRFQSGDRAAFAHIFRRYRNDVARLVFRMLGPTADAEDVIQEVFIQVHRSLGDFRGQSKFTTWLHRVTVNAVLMSRRAARSRPVFTGEPSADLEVDQGMLPDEDAARGRRIAAFRRLIARLPEKKRVVYVLHELEGIAPAEIAKIVGAPVLTVRTRLFYARREIEEMMRGEPALAQLAAELAEGSGDTSSRAAGSERACARSAVGGSAAETTPVGSEEM